MALLLLSALPSHHHHAAAGTTRGRAAGGNAADHRARLPRGSLACDAQRCGISGCSMFVRSLLCKWHGNSQKSICALLGLNADGTLASELVDSFGHVSGSATTSVMDFLTVCAGEQEASAASGRRTLLAGGRSLTSASATLPYHPTVVWTTCQLTLLANSADFHSNDHRMLQVVLWRHAQRPKAQEVWTATSFCQSPPHLPLCTVRWAPRKRRRGHICCCPVNR